MATLEQEDRFEEVLNKIFKKNNKCLRDLKKAVKDKSFENICNKLKEHILETNHECIIHIFDLIEPFKLYYNNGRELTELDYVLIVERNILVDSETTDNENPQKKLKEYMLVILEIKYKIKPENIYNKINTLYSIKEYFEKLKLFLDNYTDEDFMDINDKTKNITQIDLFGKYKEKFDYIYNYDDDNDVSRNYQGDSVKNILYDVSNDFVYALKNLNTKNIHYLFCGDKIHEDAIILMDNFNISNVLFGWNEYNQKQRNPVRKLDYTDKNQSTVPLTDDIMKSMYNFISNNIGYIDLKHNLFVSFI